LQKSLFLIGARGSGKSTVGRLIAERLGWHFCDADALLEERAGKSIRAIFNEEGEAGFRDREAALLEEIAGGCNQVVATGGGVVLRATNRELFRRGTVVWLDAPAETLWQRLQADVTTVERRPDLAQGGLAEIEDVLRVRQPLYEACADLRVGAGDRSAAEVADAIVAWLANRD
jgi:shikimate kinase